MSADFIRQHTALSRPPLVPELVLHLATEVTPLWHATEAWLHAAKLEPPFWAFAWAGGQGLARYLLDHPEVVRDRRVLDFACGGGIVGLAAKRAGARSVVAVDIDPFAITAALLNAEHNALSLATDGADWVGRPLDAFDLVVAGDIFYDRKMVERTLPWLRGCGRRVLAGDPGRLYAPSDATIIATYLVPTDEALEGVKERETQVMTFQG